MPLQSIAGEPSWSFSSSTVDAALTRRGGHLAPVTYKVAGRTISPLRVLPWAGTEPADPSLPPILQVLRGDFFCMPFGEGKPYRGERHPIHGETANADWELQSLSKNADQTHLHARLRTTVRAGRVDKHLMLVDGHPAVYSRHVISRMRGPMSYGHHAIVAFPETPGSGVISTGPFALGQVYDGAFGDPATGSYASFKPAATFKTLERVPTVFGEPTDASRFPARPGYDDLLMLQAKPKRGLGWTAVTFAKERYVWFALKDTATLPGTVMWFSNGGRHTPPWSGRHRNAAGLEEVCSYFAAGLAKSVAPNPHTRRGLRTSVTLDPKHPHVVNYIMAATPIPRGFDRAKTIARTPHGVQLIADSGKWQDVTVDVAFLGID